MEKKPCSNKNECTCPSTGCARHGRCCDCVKYHQQRGDLPMCMRGGKKEK